MPGVLRCRAPEQTNAGAPHRMGCDDGAVWQRPGRTAPRSIRILVGVLIAVFAYGGLVHVVQLALGGWPPYSWAPGWLAAYFTSLVVLDPLAAVLLWTGRAGGLYLGIVILVTDALANGYATYGLAVGPPVAKVSQAVISALALVALAAAGRIRPWLRW